VSSIKKAAPLLEFDYGAFPFPTAMEYLIVFAALSLAYLLACIHAGGGSTGVSFGNTKHLPRPDLAKEKR